MSSTRANTPALSISVTPSVSSRSSFEAIDALEVNQKLQGHVLAQIDLDDIQQLFVDIAHEAGEMMIAADPSVDTSLTKKNSSDRVTATDRAIESMVQLRLRIRYPNFDFLGEETFKEGQKLGDEPTFIVDPIDGTLNFIHGFPNTGISLAFAINKKTVVGVVYNPFRRELFSAIKGRGAYLTRELAQSRVALPVKQTPDALTGLNGALVALEWGSERTGPNWELRTSVNKKLLSSKDDGGAMVHSVRSSGSAALDFCYVAAGWFDAFWEGGCWVWDVAAGWLIVEEAGGMVVGANPDQWNPTLEGRSYFAIRGASKTEGQEQVAEELWDLMDGKSFNFVKKA